MEKYMEFWEALHGKFVAWKNTWKKHEMTLFFMPSSAMSCLVDNHPLRFFDVTWSAIKCHKVTLPSHINEISTN